jgi:hypothetical protein
MKGKWVLSLVALSSLTLLPAVSLSANASQENPPPNKSEKVRTVTGCLAKGDNANEYQLTTKNGSTWEVKSDNPTEHGHMTVTNLKTVSESCGQ